ncbi:MAG: SRPBCC family protein [Solirubrobacteraceae bacterium]
MTFEIAAPPERVWATLVDVERWPKWTGSMREVTKLDGGELATGKTVRVRQPRMPALIWEVTEFDPGKSFSWRSSSPGITTLGTHHVRSTAGNRTAVTLGIHQSGPFAAAVALLAGGRTKQYVQMEAEGLKTRCETAQPV